jgi:hypothetical protein
MGNRIYIFKTLKCCPYLSGDNIAIPNIRNILKVAAEDKAA